MLLTTRFKADLVATLLICLFYLNISYTIGHLSHDMTWDDISYALSAAERLYTLISGGLYDFFLSWTKPYPHSAYSEIVSLISVFLFGLNDYGFYVSNFLLLITAYLFIFNFFKGTERIILSLRFLFVMLSTMAYALVDNFRPDFALGLATAGLVWWTLQGVFFGRDRDLLWGGLALAAALLIKPTFFAHTVAVASGLAILTMIIQIGKTRYYHNIDIYPSSPLTYIALGIVIASPYYLFAGNEILHYFWTNTRGEHSFVWSYSERTSIYQVIKSYIFEGYLNNGGMQVPSAALITICLLPVLYLYGKRREMIVAFLLFLVAACSFGVMVFGRHNSQFFFATFHMLIMLSAVYSVGSASMKAKGTAKVLLLSTFAATIILTTAQNHNYLFTDTGQDSLRSVSENRAIVSQITQILAKDGLTSGVYKDPASIFVPVAGPVSLPTIKWEARKAGFFVSGRDIYLPNDISEYLDLARRADFVVVPHRMDAEYNKTFPSSTIQAKLAQILMQDSQFRTLPQRTPHDRYLVLARNRPDSGRFFDIDFPGSLSGFGPEEGSYPQWNLPRVAWMSSRIGEICLYEPGMYRLEMEAKTPIEANIAITSSSGTGLASLNFHPDQFQKVAVRHTTSIEDPCIAIEYDASVSPPGDNNYLLFSALKITKIKE